MKSSITCFVTFSNFAKVRKLSFPFEGPVNGRGSELQCWFVFRDKSPLECDKTLQRFEGYPSVSGTVMWSDSISTEDHDTLRRPSGNIFSLLKIRVNYPLIDTLIRFWDSDTACFRFGTYELAPTLARVGKTLPVWAVLHSLLSVFLAFLS